MSGVRWLRGVLVTWRAFCLAIIGTGCILVMLPFAGPAVAQEAGTGAADIVDTEDNDGATGGGWESALTIEGLIIARSNLDDVPFTGRGSPGASPFIAFGARDLDGDDVTFGARATLRGNILDQPFEFSTFFMAPMLNEGSPINLGNDFLRGAEPSNPANTNAVFHPENNPGADVNSTNSEDIYAMTVRHQTQLFGGEVSIVKPFGIPGLIFGPRAIFFGEELGATVMEERDDVPGVTVPPPDTTPDRDQVSVRTDNWLIGFQAGLQGMFDLSDDFRVGGSVKAGLYDNVVSRRRTFFQLDNSARLQDSRDSDHELAYAVEVNPRVEFRVADGVYLSAAGSFLWLDNVSEATSHFATLTDLQDRDTRASGDVFFYGGSLGLTMELDTGTSSAWSDGSPLLLPDGPATGATLSELEERIAELESSTARKGNSKVSFEVSGWINRMILGWDDGAKSDAYIVDNVASRSRIEFEGTAKIMRGWTAGYYLSLGLDDIASNDVSQLNSSGEGAEPVTVRHSAWWLRSNKYGTATVGLSSTATDNIILNDLGGIMPGAANIATIGGGFILRLADEPETGNDALITGNFETTLNDISGGASVDTLRRNIIRYDAPRLSGLWGNLDLSVAWGEDDFFDTAARYSINWDDIRFRIGAGYLHDTTEGNQPGGNTGSRDREEYKGSASLLHVPTGLFATAAYVQREFNGTNTSPQAIFGEVTTGIVTPPGTNRPDLQYLYTASGIRQRYSSLGETSIYGEWARVDDAIAGLREAGQREVTDSQLEMVGAAVVQNIDAAAMDVYAGFRHFSFETTGVRIFNGVTRVSPEPLTDISFAYGGVRIKF